MRRALPTPAMFVALVHCRDREHDPSERLRRCECNQVRQFSTISHRRLASPRSGLRLIKHSCSSVARSKSAGKLLGSQVARLDGALRFIATGMATRQKVRLLVRHHGTTTSPATSLHPRETLAAATRVPVHSGRGGLRPIALSKCRSLADAVVGGELCEGLAASPCSTVDQRAHRGAAERLL